MLEKEIESYLNKRIKETGGLSYKWISTIRGVPDRIVIYKGRLWLVELKTATGTLSPRQQIVFSDLDEQGFPVTVVRSKSDVENLIEEMFNVR